MAGDGPSQRLREGSDHTHQLPQDTARPYMSGKAWGERILAMVKERQRQKETLQEQEQDRQYSPLPPSFTERHKEILQLPEQLSLEKPIPHYTDTGRKIEPMRCSLNPETRVSEERYLESLDPNKKPTVLYYASDFPNTNCHGFTFTNGKVGWLNPRHVQHILEDNGFTKIGTFENNAELIDPQLQRGVTSQIGDLIIFRKKEGGLPTHSGVISSIADGQIQITSKRGSRGLYEQGIVTFPPSYGSIIEIYHTNRPGRRLLTTDQPSS